VRVSLTGVVRSFGAHTVLDRVDLTLGPRSRVGLVGPNGAGKSTLLRLAAGLDEPDEGTRRAHARVAHDRLPAAGARPSGGGDVARLPRATHRHRGGRGGREAAHGRLEPGRLCRRARALPGARRRGLESRAGAVCAELGLSVSLDQETATLSGGEAARAALAAILLSRFDLLLLDEPTNDLDFDGLERLERFVDGFAGGPRLSSPTTEPFSTEPSAASPRSTPGPAACVSTRRLERLCDGARARTHEAVRRFSRTRRSGARRSRRSCARAATRPAPAAASSPTRPAAPTGAARTRWPEGPPGAARARADRARREAVRALAAASLAGCGAAARRPRRLARGRRRRAWRLPAGAGRPPALLRESASRSRAATGAASRPCSRCCSASYPLRRTPHRRPVDRPRRARPARLAYDGQEPLLAVFTARATASLRRGAHAAREVQPRPRPRRAAVRHALTRRAHARAPWPS
jgi:energy-coupling factor transporter ATP-binding protein EcfA2